jgi:hypothetical protein
MPRKRRSDQHPATVQEIVQLAYQLSSPELDGLIAALLALREAVEKEKDEGQEATNAPSPTTNRKGRSAHIAWKMINRCGPYPYQACRSSVFPARWVCTRSWRQK